MRGITSEVIIFARYIAYAGEVPARSPSPFGKLLRYWRNQRNLSQLAIASEAEVSTRHVSFLENGRACPSREMVLLLADVLEVPLRERNAMLSAAGFAQVYRESNLSDPELSSVWHSVSFLLDRHEPYPAIAVDRHWNILRMNGSATRVFAVFLDLAVLDPALASPLNAMRILFSDSGLRPYIVNWQEFGGHLIQRLHREAMSAANDKVAQALLAEALAAAGSPSDWRMPDLDAMPAPVAKFQLRKGELELALFSAITTLGTTMDITVQELRIETFFPADEASEAVLKQL